MARQTDPGDDASPPIGETDAQTRRRFEAKFRANEHGCWVWQAHTDGDDYGQFRLEGRIERAHRAAWMIYRGPIDPGMDIDHRCDKVPGGPDVPNRKCVNPDHLEVVTHAENMRRRHLSKEGSSEPLRPTTAEEILLSAVELIGEYKRPENGVGYGVPTAEGAPWRKWQDDFEGGMAEDPSGMPLVSLFLYCVQLGVDWKAACRVILALNPLSLKRWNVNPLWVEDFAKAKTRVLRTKWGNFQESLLEITERRAPNMDSKDLVKALLGAAKHDEELVMARQRRDTGAPQLTGPRVTINIIGNREEAEQLASGVVDALYREVEEAKQLPPPEHWETSDEEVE